MNKTLTPRYRQRGKTLLTRYCLECGIFIERKGIMGGRPRFCSTKCQINHLAPPAGNTECWLWTGPTNRRGYGRFALPGNIKILAHRAAWIEANGRDIPADKVICHSCDQPLCCNPAHLFVGTQTDNMRDMIRKGRKVVHRGEKNNRSVLTEDSVRFIRANQGKMKAAEIAAALGVPKSTVANVLWGGRWSHVA